MGKLSAHSLPLPTLQMPSILRCVRPPGAGKVCAKGCERAVAPLHAFRAHCEALVAQAQTPVVEPEQACCQLRAPGQGGSLGWPSPSETSPRELGVDALRLRN